jgi:pimeloyl-ACP methyl ester carboxylesterase
MMTCKEETVKVGGRNVRLYRGGSGPPLLFLHDSFCPTWLPLHEQLAAHYEVLVPIHPGFLGSEDELNEFEEMEDLLFHYLDLCATLRLDRPALAGASFGGWIAAEWAIRYSHTLKSLILIDALGLRLTEAPAADILSLDPAAMRIAIFDDPASIVALETIPVIPKPEAMESTILARRALARFAWQFPDNRRLRRYLQRVQVPTLVLWGERDGIVTTAHGKAYHEGIAKSQFLTVANTAHLPHVEAPDTCAGIMVEFLRARSD